MSKITDLEYCVDLLQKEFIKQSKKLTDINTQIEECYFLSAKKFDNLCKKRDKIANVFHSIEYGIRYLRSAISDFKYIERMKSEK